VSADLSGIAAALQAGRTAPTRAAVEAALEAGLSPLEVLNGGLIPGMDEVGRRFASAEIFLPEVLVAARAMHAGMAVLRPLLAASGVPSQGRIVLGTVKGDLHDIGKNLVGTLLQGAGYEVIDLGTDVEADRFIDTALEHEAPLIGMSALLTTTMTGMVEVVGRLKERGLDGRLRTIVGGAPVRPDWARSIGADGWAANAPGAVTEVRRLLAPPSGDRRWA
jgi:5-methyltetrahydrofolate--homocysteine methyltransferase